MTREQEIAHLKTTLSLDTGDFKKELSSATKQTAGLKKSFDIASKSIENAEDKFEATTKAISRGEKALTSMTNKLELQKTRYDNLKSVIDKQKISYEDLTKELNKAETELADLEKAENKNIESIENQKKEIDKLKQKLKDKSQVIGDNINKLQNYSNAIDKTENDLTSLENQLGKAKKSLNEIENATSNNGLETFKELASETGVNLNLLELGAKGAAIALATVVTSKIIEGAGTYDKAITDLQITMGITEESAKSLYREVHKITDGGYSVESITESVKMLEQRFNLSSEETENLAQGMALLNQQGYENKDIIRFMTSAVNDWGMTHEGALDYIIAGEQEGLNISEDWMDTLTEYTPILSTLGVKGNEAFVLISEAMKTTGLDSDKSADMIKEFFLTLTDGSKTSTDAFADLGLNINTFKTQIDNGSMTSVEAMQKVMKAISGVKDETEQARLLQEIFKGTIEYGSIGVVEAWGNMENSIVNTEGAIDQAKETYEGSYDAMKQDLTQSWDELTQTIGANVLPSLLEIVQSLLTIPFHMDLAGSQISMSWDWVMAQLDNGWLGFIGVFQEGIVGILEGSAKVSKALGMEGIAKDLENNAESMGQKHKETVDKIVANEKVIVENSNKLGKLWNANWDGTLEENKNLYDKIMGNATEGFQKTSRIVSNELDNQSKKVSESTGKAKNTAKKNYKEIKESAKTELKGASSEVNNNMDDSLKAVQVQATEMYKGVKTSFYKMKVSAKEDGTEMYLGVKKSAQKMCDSAKRSATSMYLGVTTSTNKMAKKAIADWNSIRNTYSKGITGKISTTHTKININKDSETFSAINSIQSMSATLNTPNMVKAGQYYNNDSVQSVGFSRAVNNSNYGILNEIRNLSKRFNSQDKTLDKNIYLEIPLSLEGREIARVSAKYINDEIKILNNREDRNRGIF